MFVKLHHALMLQVYRPSLLVTMSSIDAYTIREWPSAWCWQAMRYLTDRHEVTADLDMLNAQPLHNAGREDPASESPPEDGIKLFVQATYAQALKVECLGLKQLGSSKALLAQYPDVVVICRDSHSAIIPLWPSCAGISLNNKP